MPDRTTSKKTKKALVIVPFPLDAAGVALRREQLKAVQLSGDVRFEFRPVKASCTSYVSDHDWFLMDAGCFEAGLSAEKEGFDAVIVDTMADSAVGALRSVLDIPVIGPGRVAQHYALLLGGSFSILTMNTGGLHNQWSWVTRRRLAPFCVSVEAAVGSKPSDVAALLTGREEEMFPLLKAAGQRAIDKGAEVLILGSTTMHQSGEWLAANLPVPVVNPGPLSYKMAETMLALGHRPSRQGHPAPKVEKRGMIHAMLEAAAAWEKGAARAAPAKAKTARKARKPAQRR